jgi:coenzyme Q-binding protein COQ10
MASASVTEVFNCSVPEFYKIISDYESYPKFLPECKACHVVEVKGNRKLVEMKINLIKNFTYSLWMTENEPNAINWEFAHGDIFKQLNGSWKLSDEAGKTRATYAIDAKMGLFVPGPIAKGLIEVNLPSMMGSYHKRVEELYGSR